MNAKSIRDTIPCEREHGKQEGFALIVSILFLAVLTALGINAMRTSALEEKMASNTQHHNVAFRAAETGLSIGLSNAGAATTTSNQENSEATYKVDIAQGQVCNESENAGCASGWEDKSVATVDAFTEYTTEAKVPPVGYSLDGPFATHHFRVESGATYGTTRTRVSQGFRRLGPTVDQ
ncbi:MAG: hypothetical protein DWQ08_07070 [Proteobacteria bacterium]|nr:MAG: hypothetical protein DWQ08_07070 [Pseudomonadota bacterium]